MDALSRVRELAAEIDAAHRERRLLDATGRPALDLDTAYRVQRELTAVRVLRGARRIGAKLGYTSQAMREQMRIDAPNHGPLLSTMRITDGRVPATLVQPRAEPEVAVVLGPDARPAAAYGALEVVDSVWRDVLTGGLTAAVPVEPGDTVEAVFGDFGSVRLSG